MTTHRPRRTFFTLSVPVLLSLLAEPLTGFGRCAGCRTCAHRFGSPADARLASWQDGTQAFT